MADYANCPTCHGRGLIPLADAEAIQAHADANAQVTHGERRQREQDVIDARIARLRSAAEDRLAAFKSLVT